MKGRKKYLIISMILLFISLNLLSLAAVYYAFEDEIERFKYSDNDEYSNINKGIKLIDSLPIQFNIINKYFSDFDNLSKEDKESIILAYTIKNKIGIYNCDGTDSSICIDKEELKKSNALSIFNTKTELLSNNIKAYIDDHGNYNIHKSSTETHYRVSLDNVNDPNSYRKYSKFYKYKEEKDMYIFYMYEGYYNGNCIPGEAIDLYDFISGKVVYSDICNNNKEFTKEPTKDIKGLQLYKYELKKDEENHFYLYGYNPVNKK